jgi:hypothetical protein
MSETLTQIIVCHSRFDKSKAKELSQSLIRQKHRVCFDDKHRVFSEQWQVELKAAIAVSDIMIVVLSAQTPDNIEEIKLSLDLAHSRPTGELIIIPVKLAECTLPQRLNGCYAIDWFAKDGEARLDRLLHAIKANIKLSGQPYLWGNLEIGRQGADRHTEMLGDKPSGYELILPGSKVELRIEADFVDRQKVLKLSAGEGVQFRYLNADNQQTGHSYIDHTTHTIEVESAQSDTAYFQIDFIHQRFIENLINQEKINEEDFIGQEAIVDKIISQCDSGNGICSFLLSGISHAGKTTLINHLQWIFGAAKYRARFHVIKLDYKPWRGNKLPSFELFKGWFYDKTAGSNGQKKTLFFIDDYDCIFDDYKDDFNQLFKEHQQQHLQDVYYILAGRRSLSFFKQHLPHYQLPANTQNIAVKGFDQQSEQLDGSEQSLQFIDHLLEGVGLRLHYIKETEKQNIADQAGHYPYLIMRILQQYLEHRLKRKADAPTFVLPADFVRRYRQLIVKPVLDWQKDAHSESQIPFKAIVDLITDQGGVVTEQLLLNHFGQSELSAQENALQGALQILGDMGLVSLVDGQYIVLEPKLLCYRGTALVGKLQRGYRLSQSDVKFAIRTLLIVAYMLCSKRLLRYDWFELPNRMDLDQGVAKLALAYNCQEDVDSVYDQLEQTKEIFTVPPLWLEWQLLDTGRLQPLLDGVVDKKENINGR